MLGSELRKTRIAPTPSGFLHWGNAVSFVLTAAMAEKSSASLLLRIDDLDTERVKPEQIEDVFDTLNWLGIECDSGPKTPEDLIGKWSQLHRLNAYRDLINEMLVNDMLYPCACSRSQIAQRGGLNSDHHECRTKKVEENQPECSWRIRLPDHCMVEVNDLIRGKVLIDLNSEMRDFVVRRRDGIPSYQIASLADDLAFGIDLVVRGNDLLASTAAQLFIARSLNKPTFQKSIFLHHELILGKDGNKLSKTEGSEAIKTIRSNGMTRADAYTLIARTLGVPNNPTDLKSFSQSLIPEVHLTN